MEVKIKTIGLLTIADTVLYESRKLPVWLVRRRVKNMERLLRQHGVRRLIIDEAFPYSDCLVNWSLVDALPFYRSIADLLALAQLRCKGILPNSAVVAVSAPRISPELRSAAERLCQLVKGIAIDVPEEGERYAAWLHRQFGLPIRAAGDADVTLAFAPVANAKGDLILLHQECLSLNGLRVTAPELDLPEGYDARLLAALWERGSLERKSLHIEGRKPLDKSI